MEYVHVNNDSFDNTTKHSQPTGKRARLTESEQREAEQFEDVYYVPYATTTKKIGRNNRGYDDENNRLLTCVNDHIGFRYQILCKLGMGAFGDCYRCLDHKNMQEVAVKVIRNEPRFRRQAQIEIDILNKLSKEAHDNHTVVLLDKLDFRNHVCLVFELHGQDLYSSISGRDFAGFTVRESAAAITNILQSLALLKRHRIVHSDLKPENVLVGGQSAKGEVVVIDLGSACYESQKIQTYVQSRYYRAPEIVIGHRSGCPIDMWSVGCILFELITGRPLFHAKNERDLLLYQMEVFGIIPPHVLRKSRRIDEFFIDMGDSIVVKTLTDRRGRIKHVGTRDLASAVGVSDSNLVHFLRRCLDLDPEKRITPEEALKHPFIVENNSTFKPKHLLTARDTGSSESIDSGVDSELDSSPLKRQHSEEFVFI